MKGQLYLGEIIKLKNFRIVCILFVQCEWWYQLFKGKVFAGVKTSIPQYECKVTFSLICLVAFARVLGQFCHSIIFSLQSSSSSSSLIIVIISFPLKSYVISLITLHTELFCMFHIDISCIKVKLSFVQKTMSSAHCYYYLFNDL